MRNRLRELRAARGWSQADLADRLDVSRQRSTPSERAASTRACPLAFKLAAVCEGRIEDLFFPPADIGPQA